MADNEQVKNAINEMCDELCDRYSSQGLRTYHLSVAEVVQMFGRLVQLIDHQENAEEAESIGLRIHGGSR